MDNKSQSPILFCVYGSTRIVLHIRDMGRVSKASDVSD